MLGLLLIKFTACFAAFKRKEVVETSGDRLNFGQRGLTMESVASSSGTDGAQEQTESVKTQKTSVFMQVKAYKSNR